MNWSFLQTPLASIQWFLFIFTNTIVVPISIGTAFQLPQAEISGMLQMSFILTGIACLLQGLIGHQYPIMEGHAGLMWGLILNLSVTGASLGMNFTQIGGGIATGILLANAVIILFVIFNLVPLLERVFSPMVMTVFLFLLSFQLAIIFFKGMLKYTANGGIVLSVSLFSIIIVVFVSLLKLKGNDLLGNFSVLIGLVGGWLVYALIFPSESIPISQNIQTSIFPLGKPNVEIGMIVITFLGCMINMSNTFSSLQAAGRLFKQNTQPKRYKQSLLLTSFYSMCASCFGLVPYAPFASAIGFLESTRIFLLKPFLYGGGLMVVLGLSPTLISYLGTMPITVGNAVLFVAYLQMFGTALKSMGGATFDSKTVFRIAGPILLGISLMNISEEVISSLPGILQPLFANGLVIGILLSIILELFINWDKLSEK